MRIVDPPETAHRDGTRAYPALSGTQVAFDPVDFIARLAALVPKPRVIVGTPNRCIEDQDVIPDKAGQAPMAAIILSIKAGMTWR